MRAAGVVVVGLWGSLLLGVVCASGCTVPRRSIGQQCEIDSDCQAPLVCGFGRCRRACDVDRDCVPPAYCVVDPETGLGSCALDDELRCALDSDCAEGLVCRLGTCTTACADDRDCPPGTRCNRTQGETPFCEAAASKGCLYDGDCPDGLVCGADRRCRYECFLSSECAGGGRCVDNRCVVPDGGTTPAVDAGPARCRSDAQCDDGTFCNGAERCRPGAVGADDFGCAPPDGPACPADTTCDEAIDGCVSACDQDGDGHARPGACGGDDCDDADGSVHPGVPDDCNYRDDDCDGMEDEDVDRSSDPRHCGLCGNDCAAPNATGRCVDSVCVLEACLPGYADLDGRRTNGCEHLCDPAAPDPCNGADDDCDGAIDEDPPTDSCSTVNATPSCVEGACALTCDDGFEDCNGDVRDGCEADFGEPRTCGSCNARCGAALACTPSGCESAAVRAIAAGGRTCCALRDHGRLACWGENVASSFGGGPYGLHGAPRAGAAGPFEAVALGLRGGMASGCALDASGAVWCWGSNEYGQAGVDPASSTLVSAPSIVSGASSAQAVGVGAFHVCALTAAGTVQCWGNDTAGELGQGSASSEPQPLPQDVPGLSGVVGLGVGRAHTCAVVAGGEVRCWGDNQSDQSGATCGRECVSPTAIAGLTGAVEVAAGSFFSCARLGTGEVFCWGNNGYGQLGAGIPDLTSTTPVAVSGIDDAVQLALGGNFACALSSGGGVSCWGEDRAGQLGDGTVGGERDVPAPVVGLPTGVVEIAAGWEHACARTTDGEVWCWGRGADGQLGDEGFDRSATPVRARYLP